MALILGVFEEGFEPRGVLVPSGYETAVRQALKQPDGILIKGKRYPQERIISQSLFTEAEWPDIERGLREMKPTPQELKQELSWENMRSQPWYTNSAKRRR